MNNPKEKLIVTYIDNAEHFTGWLVINDLSYKLAAGGLRVQKGLTLKHLELMSDNMGKKMKICGLPISGAKAGIDFDPSSPKKYHAVEKFIRAIEPYMLRMYSMGSDLNTNADELNKIVQKLGLSSIKSAIKIAQNFSGEEFANREKILLTPIFGNYKLGNIRAGYSVAMCALALIEKLGLDKNKVNIAVQGFGVLGKGTIYGLLSKGLSVASVSDIKQTIQKGTNNQLPLEQWIRISDTKLPIANENDFIIGSSQDILSSKSDVLILAAIENAITEENVDSIKAKLIISGANLAISEKVQEILYKRGSIVLPSFVSGAGGPMSMNAVFGPDKCPTKDEVFDYLEQKSKEIVNHILDISDLNKISPLQAANKIIYESNIPIGKPYYAKM